MILRIVGMIIQYMGSTINAECFVVLNSELHQEHSSNTNTKMQKLCYDNKNSWNDYPVLLMQSVSLYLITSYIRNLSHLVV